ncbi:thioredoxin [Candidatus Woesearchaeota archaeon]|nr:thioredoxin [Candidatus Woesearchaeota archaeon]
MALENILQVTDATFEKDVLQASLPVIVDFYTTWCPPCKAMAPVYAEVSTLYAGKVAFAKCDCGENKIAATYQIRSVPTLILFRNGEEVARRTGYLEKGALKRFIDTGVKA